MREHVPPIVCVCVHTVTTNAQPQHNAAGPFALTASALLFICSIELV